MATEKNMNSAASGNSALVEEVWRRMNESGGFPALSSAVQQIVEALENDNRSNDALSHAVLSDFSLTQKVLRLANSAMYASIAKNVTTVSHALMILGAEAVGRLALGAKVISSMSELGQQSQGAEQELAQSILAGSVAGEVVSRLKVANGEEGVVCALLYRLGKLLVTFFLPDHWRRIQQLVKAGRAEEEAARTVLNLTYRELGTEVARKWRLPEKIVNVLSLDPRAEGADPAVAPDWITSLTRFSNEAAGMMSNGGADPEKMEQLAARYGTALDLEPEALLTAVRLAKDEATAEPTLSRLLLDGGASVRPSGKPDNASSLLDTGVKDVEQAIGDGCTLDELAHITLEVMYFSLGLIRAVWFRHDDAFQVYSSRVRLAGHEDAQPAEFTIPAGYSADVVHLSLAKNADIYIERPDDPKMMQHLPDWIRRDVPESGPFFLLPVSSGNGSPPFGFYYGRMRPGTVLDKDELNLLKRMRGLLQDRVAGHREGRFAEATV